MNTLFNKLNQNKLMDKEYSEKRRTDKALRYRLWRRTQEVVESIEEFHPNTERILDIGTADGLMPSALKKKYPQARCIGIEFSESLTRIAGQDKLIEIFQADAQYLPFKNETFDIVIAAAIIEHIPNPQKMLLEINRVLIKSGLFIITTPDPYWEYLATLVRHLPKEQHNKVMNLKELQRMISKANLQVVKTKKFMISPIGMPLEFKVEKIVRTLGLNFLFANQLAVGRKKF